MTYSYFLKLKSYINTYISVTYTEPTVSNHLPQGNHNYNRVEGRQNYTVSNHLPQGNHNKGEDGEFIKLLLVTIYRKVITTSEDGNLKEELLLVTIYRKVITTSIYNTSLLK